MNITTIVPLCLLIAILERDTMAKVFVVYS